MLIEQLIGAFRALEQIANPKLVKAIRTQRVMQPKRAWIGPACASCRRPKTDPLKGTVPTHN